MDSTRKAPDDQLPSTSRTSYADVVKTNLPLKDDWWRRFQAEDEDEAIEKALQASLEDAKVVFFLFCTSYLLVWQLTRSISKLVDFYLVFFLTRSTLSGCSIFFLQLPLSVYSTQ